MELKLSNNADGLLAMAISDSDTSLTLVAGHGSRFPALGSGDWFPITVVRASDPSQFEIMRCTARSGDTLTVVRAQEGTSAITFDAGDVVSLRLTSGTLEENFPQVEGRNAKNLRFSIDSVGGKPELKFKSGGNEETVVRRSDIGTAAARDVTTSPTDTTEGRVLKVGDFGVGGAILLPAGANLNTVVNSGFYRLGDTVVNAPVGVAYGQLIVARGGDTIVQIVAGYDSGEIYWRQGNPPDVGGPGSWSGWYRFFHSGNLALPIGVGQTWYDVTDYRGLNIYYTNSTGRPIAVYIRTASVLAGVYISLNIGGVTLYGPEFGAYGDPSRSASIFAIIPPGAQYAASSNEQVFQWAELR